MLDDPRHALAPGVYRATVTKAIEGWLPNGERGIESVEYSLPDCGEWRWAIRDDTVFGFGERVSQKFLVDTVIRGWFEFTVGTVTEAT